MKDANTVSRLAQYGNEGAALPELGDALTTIVAWADCAALDTPGLRFGAYDPAELQRAESAA